MKFLSQGIGARIHGELGSAAAAKIVVAYFLPDPATEAVLRAVPDLAIIYLDEYTITDPTGWRPSHRLSGYGA